MFQKLIDHIYLYLYTLLKSGQMYEAVNSG